jgi:hypothetical protein
MYEPHATVEKTFSQLAEFFTANPHHCQANSFVLAQKSKMLRGTVRGELGLDESVQALPASSDIPVKL